MKDYTKRFFGRVAKEMGHGKAQATVTAMKRADKGAAKHLFSQAQKAAKRGRYSGKRKRWPRCRIRRDRRCGHYQYRHPLAAGLRVYRLLW